jgi:hypothetical protein
VSGTFLEQLLCLHDFVMDEEMKPNEHIKMQ